MSYAKLSSTMPSQNLLDDLNPIQQEAVKASGNCKAIAALLEYYKINAQSNFSPLDYC